MIQLLPLSWEEGRKLPSPPSHTFHFIPLAHSRCPRPLQERDGVFSGETQQLFESAMAVRGARLFRLGINPAFL